MKCDKCKKEMEAETLFTSVKYNCKHCNDNSWMSVDEMTEMLKPMDFPIKLKFMDDDGTTGAVFVSEHTYFSRCPKERKFKVIRLYDPYVGYGYESDGDMD